MGLRAGGLDRRITILRYGMTRNADNEPIEAWVDVGKRWASKEDVSDGEKVRAAQVGASVTTRFRVRNDSLTRTLTGADRISYKGKVYSISGIKETEGRNDGFEITASAAADPVTP
jgi:SPP1 family predicted phage head-tail adaptor